MQEQQQQSAQQPDAAALLYKRSCAESEERKAAKEEASEAKYKTEGIELGMCVRLKEFFFCFDSFVTSTFGHPEARSLDSLCRKLLACFGECRRFEDLKV